MKRHDNAFTLMELMVVVFILQLVICPLYVVFSGSKKIMMSARDVTSAVSLGSSMIAALREIDRKKLFVLEATAEGDLPSVYTPENLGLSRVSDGFRRFLTVKLIDTEMKEGGPYYEATVEIRWKKGKQANAPEVSLNIKGLIGEKNR